MNEELVRLRNAGFTEPEIQEYVRADSEKMRRAGFSEEEIGKHYGQPDTRKANSSLASTVKTVLAAPVANMEATLNLATGMLVGFPAYMLGGLVSLGRRAEGLTDEDPKVIGQRWAEAVTYMPQTTMGKKVSETLLTPFHALMEFSEKAGKKVADVTGSPTAAALTEATIQMLPAPVIGSLGRRLAGRPVTVNEANNTARVIAPSATEGAVAKIQERITDVYEKTGIDPQAVYEASRTDPTVIQDLVSTNRPVPESLRVTPTELPLGGGGREPPQPPPRAAEPPAEPPRPPTSDQEIILSRVASEPEPQGRTFRQQMHDIYTQVLDKYHPIAMEAGRAAPTSVGPYELQRLTAGVSGKAKQFIENGTFDAETYANTGMSYKAVLDMAKEDPVGFKAYTLAKHNIERLAAGKETGIDLEASRRFVADNEARFEAASQARVAYKDALLEYAVKSGILSRDAMIAFKEAYKAHVPLYRLMEEAQPRAAGQTPRNPFKGAKGSEREIIDPLISDINDTFTVIALSERNMARRALVDLGPDYAKPVPDPVRPIKVSEPEIRKMFDEFVSTVRKSSTKTKTETTSIDGGSAAPENKVVQMNRERVMDALTSRGFSANEAEIMIKRLQLGAKEGAATVEKVIKEVEKTEYIPEINIRVDSDVATIFRAMQAPAGKSDIVVMIDGKRKVFRVDPDVAEAYNGLDASSASMLTGMFSVLRPSAYASLLRAGITLSPDFMMRNIVRDAVGAFVYAGSHPVKTVKGAISYFKEDAAYQNWLKGGGANSAMISMDRHYLEGHLHILKETGHLEHVWNYVKSPLEAMRIVSEVTENVTRLGMAVDELQVAQSKATIQALSMITREGTVDFARHGANTFLQEWNRSSAFLNPSLQGIDRMVRAFKDNPTGTTAKAFAAITIPSMLLWYANHDDQWTDPETGITINRWNEIPAWQRDLFWIVLTKDHVYRIPKPFELGVVFGSVPERILDAYYKEKPDAFKHLGKSLLDAFTFNIVPTVALPPVQQMTNFSFFTDRPLVPSSMEKVLPKYQYTPYTTELTKQIANLIGAIPGMDESSMASPIVVDNYIRGWSGTIGQYIVNMTDAALRSTGVLPDPVKAEKSLADMPIIKAFMIRMPSGTVDSVKNFYEDYKKVETKVNTINMLMKHMDVDSLALEERLYISQAERLVGINNALANIRSMIILIDLNKDYTAGEKRQLIDTAYMQMMLIASAGNEAMREIKKTTSGITLH